MKKKISKKIISKELKTVSKKKRRYEGASKAKRLSRWHTPSTSADSANEMSFNTLRDRARDLRRNNPYAANGIRVLSNEIVGTGILTQFRKGKEVVSTLEKQWKDWAETTQIDFDGVHDIYGLQTLITEAIVESGEVLVRKFYDTGNIFPLQYQVLESDFIDTTKNETLPSGGFILQGIEFDSRGKKIAYHLFKNHPGNLNAVKYFTNETVRVPVSEIYHIYRMDRPGQTRGISWLAPVIVRLKDLDDYEDAQLMRQKIAACFAAFVKDISSDPYIDNPDCDPEDLEGSVEAGSKIEPGTIETLPAGKDVTFANPPQLTSHEAVLSAYLHGIAAGLGITYEALTGVLKEVNFSSARMGWLQMAKNVKSWREKLIILRLMAPIANDFLNVLKIKGEPVEAISVIHVPPKQEMIDPTKEIPAKGEAIRLGLMTLTEAILEQGKDPVEHFIQYAADMENLDSKKIDLESDFRKSVKNISKQPVQGENKNAS